MLDFLTITASSVAEETVESSDMFASLGIDWQTLILQMIGFVLLVIILAKFIYPQIAAMLDRREKIIKDSLDAAREAQEKSAKSEAETATLLEKARKSAGDIVDTAKKESADIVASAEADATKRADAIVENAKVELDREIENARKSLRGEVVELVAIATEKVVDAKITSQDEKVIAEALKGRK